MKSVDNELIDWIVSSDHNLHDKAFRKIYTENYGLIEKFILVNNGRVQDAEDIFQDAIIVLFDHVTEGGFELNCTVRTYLYSVCRNLWLKRLRKTKRVQSLNDLLNDTIRVDESSFLSLEAEEQTKSISDLLDALGEKCKEVLLLFYYDRLKMSEIALRMNLSNEQVAKNKKSFCLKKLKELVLKTNALNNQL